MLFLHRSPRWAYAIAIGGAVLITLTGLTLPRAAASLMVAVEFLVILIASATLGGWKPGILATVLSIALAKIFLVEPLYSIYFDSAASFVSILAYAIAGVTISSLCEGLHTAWSRIEERQRRLEEEIAERRKAELHVQEQAEQLREADRRKDEFLAMLAHELRNPLAPLSNALQVWPFVESNAAEMEELRGIMERQIQQMTRLIDDLLDVSRISRGKIQLRPQKIDLNSIISTVVESLDPVISAGGHELLLSIPTETIYIHGDSTRLSQIFGNVLHNAAKYTPRNGEIRLTAEKNDSLVVVRIRDNGCGIPEQMLSRIFEMFHQVDQTLDRSHGGLGIGLTLVKRLVELHGGTITAHSDGPNRGSEFVISLPLLPVEPADSTTSADGRAASSDKGVPRHRVLVVDDVRASAQTLALVLQAIGQDVTTQFDGQSAIEWAMQNRPDVIFLDIAMPGMNGYEVAKKLRATSETRNILLIALTGYGQEEDRRQALEAGFDHHMTKPASLDALRQLLIAGRNYVPQPKIKSLSSPELELIPRPS